MDIREARSDENDELIVLQKACPQGKKLIASVVNTPDFFARAKAYESSKVLVAVDGKRIIGSLGFAVRKAIINGETARAGYGFQGFVAQAYRRRGVLRLLQAEHEKYAAQKGVRIIYTLVMEGNWPSIRYHENSGFKLLKRLIVPGIPVYKEMDVPLKTHVKPAVSEDLPAIARILNETWQGCELYEPMSAEALERFIKRTPSYSLDNLLVFKNGDEIMACLGYWNWSEVMRITLHALSMKIRWIEFLVRTAGFFKPMPRSVKPGDILKQIVLTPIGFKKPEHLAVLLRNVNNLALQKGIEQIFCICEGDHVMLKSMRGFIRVNTVYNLYTKTLQPNGLDADKPVYIDGIDL